MSNFLTSPQYPFDPTGINPANRVLGELHPLTGAGDRDFYFVVPLAAPFFAESIQLSYKTLQGEIRPLVEGIDYYLTHYFLGASRACAKPIYGSINFLNRELRGTLIINTMQVVGGSWTVDTNTIASILANQLYNPRSITWEQVAGYPTIFPPVPHEWNLRDMVGMSTILNALDGIVDAILQNASSAMTTHMAAQGNVHGLTAEMIGAVTYDVLEVKLREAVNRLGKSTDEMLEGVNNKFFTEARVLATKLDGYVSIPTTTALANSDTLLAALTKLQGQLKALNDTMATKANVNRPHFTGLGSQQLVKVTMTGSFALDITQSEAFQILVKGSGAISFDTQFLGDMTNRVIEFAITTVNDVGGSYAIAWPANVNWVDGVPPPRSTTAGAKDNWYFVSEDGGVSYVGSLSNANPR